MAIEKMKRLRLIAAKSEREDLFQELIKLGCLQISEQVPESSFSEESGCFFKEKVGLLECKTELETLVSGIELLNKYAPRRFSLFRRRPRVSIKALLDEESVPESIALCEAIRLTDEQIVAIKTEEIRLKGLIEALKPWISLDIPLGMTETETCELLMGTLPASIKPMYLDKDLSMEAPESQLLQISSDKSAHYVVLVAMKVNRQSVIEAAQKYGYEPVSFDGMEKAAGEISTEFKNRLTSLTNEKKDLSAFISAMSPSENELRLKADRLLNKVVMAENMENLLCTDYTINFEAFFLAKDEKRLVKVLAEFDCAWEINEPAKEETAIVPFRLGRGLFYRMRKRKLLRAGRKQFHPLKIKTGYVNILNED